jgi:serine/threonine-protein kinase
LQSLVFMVLLNLQALVLSPSVTFAGVLRSPANHWHLAGGFVSLAAWQLAARVKFTGRALPAFDAAASIAPMLAYAALSLAARHPGLRPEFIALLICMLFQMLRAVMVPSDWRFTAAVGAGMSLPVVAVAWTLGGDVPQLPGASGPLMVAIYVGLWCLACTVTAALASQVIYGLRKQVREAKRLGQYVLGDKLGEGGMGIVYKAQHALLRRPTAVKLLQPEKAGQRSLSRFEREVQLTSRLTHPNTVAIYDYGRTPNGIFYYAMEYLDGLDLQALVERHGPQDPSRVVHILAQVSSALAEAHSIGLVHRDIKPANVILCERGGVPDVAKVLDFGLVKELEGGDAQASLALSGESVVLGTPLYLPPEALTKPDSVDERSDLYALGAVAYFLLTGKPVFEGDSVVQVCSHHLQTLPTPPSERLGRRLPSDLEAVVLQCLEKNPARRPQTARELRDELLATGVPPWTDADARAWWSARGERQGATSTARAAAMRSDALTIAIDMKARELADTDVA